MHFLDKERFPRREGGMLKVCFRSFRERQHCFRQFYFGNRRHNALWRPATRVDVSRVAEFCRHVLALRVCRVVVCSVDGLCNQVRLGVDPNYSILASGDSRVVDRAGEGTPVAGVAGEAWK